MRKTQKAENVSPLKILQKHTSTPMGSRVMESEEKYRSAKILVKLGDRMHCCSSFTVKSRSQRPKSGVGLS